MKHNIKNLRIPQNERVVFPFDELIVDGKNILNKVSYIEIGYSVMTDLDTIDTLDCEITLNLNEYDKSLYEKVIKFLYDEITSKIEQKYLFAERYSVIRYVKEGDNFVYMGNTNFYLCLQMTGVDLSVNVKPQKFVIEDLPYADKFDKTKFVDCQTTVSVEYNGKKDDFNEPFTKEMVKEVKRKLSWYNLYLDEYVINESSNGDILLTFNKVLTGV